LALPLSFLILSGLALLFEFNVQPAGVINLPVFQGYFIVSRPAQLRAALVLSRALGAISCLYLLSLTTTMSEIIGVLRRFHTPDIMIELMYLIYRYTFILLDMHRSMKDAAGSRLGFMDFSTSVHTTGRIYSNLLVRSYRQANINFDAMESRCYTGEIRFLESHKRATVIQIIAAVCLILFTLGVTIAFY
jgi:cobalt/nickel transport system permease protein